jgi:hypothetical protein
VIYIGWFGEKEEKKRDNREIKQRQRPKKDRLSTGIEKTAEKKDKLRYKDNR